MGAGSRRKAGLLGTARLFLAVAADTPGNDSRIGRIVNCDLSVAALHNHGQTCLLPINGVDTATSLILSTAGLPVGMALHLGDFLWRGSCSQQERILEFVSKKQRRK